MTPQPRLSTYAYFCLFALYFGATGGFLYPSLVINSTSGSLWMPILLWAGASAASCLLYARVLGRLGGQPLVPYTRGLLGPAAASLAMLPVMLFAIGAIVVMLRSFSELVSMTLLPTTPIAFLDGMIAPAALLAAAGLPPIFRAARALFLMAFLILLFLMLVGLINTHLYYGGPWLRPDPALLLSGGFFGGSFLWMGFTFVALCGSFDSGSSRKFRKGYLLSLGTGTLLVLAFVYLPVLTFGRELGSRLTFPFVTKMDSVYQYWIVFENLTAIFLSATMLSVMIVLALKLRAIGSMASGLWPRLPADKLILGGALAVFALSTLIPEWRDVESWVFHCIALRLYALFAFPLLLLIVQRSKRAKEDAA
ncbi:GerAB/ArcD/ProY family transporter [Paenibacillus albicereus]|uniref:GerAB/ArcD/ProY family transporter n=1 Tax=Paenibacillus albicereus TaxID=2726185 RepID=A0A6H2GVC3_9BACL|nr:GerAB/ArcD/ProY family transporter [Paenibacillus albicereus]QJC51098.1 GerAB/ArcD/ProY family transporter [Paenibacillus albicereus]